MEVQKLKSSDIRIGNYLEFDGELSIVKEIDEQGLVVDIPKLEEKEWIDLFQFSVIPLTEEWLINLGFNNSQVSSLFTNKIALRNSIKSKFTLRVSDALAEIEVKYVHQLQNLYHALTGEELMIK